MQSTHPSLGLLGKQSQALGGMVLDLLARAVCVHRVDEGSMAVRTAHRDLRTAALSTEFERRQREHSRGQDNSLVVDTHHIRGIAGKVVQGSTAFDLNLLSKQVQSH